MASTHSPEHAPLIFPSSRPLVRPSAFPERRLARRSAVEGRDPAYFPPNRRPATDDDEGGVREGDSVRGSESAASRIARGARNARDIYVAASAAVAGEVCSSSMYCACNMAWRNTQ